MPNFWPNRNARSIWHQSLVRLQRINYAKGGIGILNLLDAQRTYQQALQGQIRAEAQRYQDTIQLLVAMGGGWWGANLTVAENDSPDVAKRQ